MNDNYILLLYIEHLIKPLETIIKDPKFNRYPKKEQQEINHFLLQQYRKLEQIINGKISF